MGAMKTKSLDLKILIANEIQFLEYLLLQKHFNSRLK